jgi:hypothetical protein
MAQWQQVIAEELPKLNAQLRNAHLVEITTGAASAPGQ